MLLVILLAAVVGWRLLAARLAVEPPAIEEMQSLGEVVELTPTEAEAPETPVPPPIAERRQPSEERVEQFQARRPKTVVDLQQWREEQTLALEAPRGGRMLLSNLDAIVNTWFLLFSEPEDGPRPAYHLENSDPGGQLVRLDPVFPTGLILSTADGDHACDLWSGRPSSLELATAQPSPYVPLCDRRLYLRNPVQGRRTALEWTTDFLRDNVSGGEKITVFVRQTLYEDAFRVSSEVTGGEAGVADGETRRRPAGLPPRPLLLEGAQESQLEPAELGLSVAGRAAGDPLSVGRWYPLAGLEGIYVSAIEARLVAPEIVERQRRQTNPLDEIELSALTYLVAFDLSTYEVAFSMGTDHPRVGWSERVLEEIRDPSLPGPDGFATIAPLVATGMVPPYLASRTVAAFTGGFKRSHGAFRTSPLARENFGSHYGFLEAGTLLSKLQPGLATFVGYVDGTVELKTWTEADARDLDRIVSARQNGLPLIEPDAETGESRVGTYVPRWADGNWSGSVDKRLRTLRAAICTVSSDGDEFLLYAYFSTATPSAMARVLAAYRCGYAMMTDMNALEHTYLALYRRAGARLEVEHLIEGMHVLDKEEGGVVAPRFLTFPDNRDFFYVLRREAR